MFSHDLISIHHSFMKIFCDIFKPNLLLGSNKILILVLGISLIHTLFLGRTKFSYDFPEYIVSQEALGRIYVV